MHHAAALLMLVLAAACGRETPRNGPVVGSAAAPAPAPAALPADSGAFLYLRGADTLAVETFRTDGGELAGELHDLGLGTRIAYRASLDDRLRVHHLDIHGFEPDAAQPIFRATLFLRGDTLVLEMVEDGQRMAQDTVVPAGTTLYLNPSLALLEKLLLRAEQGAPLRLLSFSLSEEPRLVEPTVERTADGAVFTIPGRPPVTLRLDGGRIIGGGTDLLRFERTR
jgi:hypothetical protein